MESIKIHYRVIASQPVHGKDFREMLGYYETRPAAAEFFDAMRSKYLVVELQRSLDSGAWVRERLYDNSREMLAREMQTAASKIRAETPDVPQTWTASPAGLSVLLLANRSVRASFYMPDTYNLNLLERNSRKILTDLRIGFAEYVGEEYQANTGSPSATLAHFLASYRDNHTVLVATNWVLKHHGLGPVTGSGI